METYYIYDFLFKEPYNRLSSDAKIILSIFQKDEELINGWENLGGCKKYYQCPIRKTLDEIAEMTNLTLQQVYNAVRELESFGLRKGDGFTCH